MWALPNFKPIMGNMRLPMSLWPGTNVIPYRQGCKENTLTFLDLFDVLVKCKEQKYEFTQTHETCAIDIEPITITRKMIGYWKSNHIPRTHIVHSRALLLRHGIVYASLSCKMGKKDPMKVCFNIHATGHQINSSFCNRTYPRLLLKHKIIKLSLD